MGRNLALNFEGNGFRVSVFNRMSTAEKHITGDFLKVEASGKNIHATYSPKEFVESLEKPRTILLMVKAGKAVDLVIKQLLPHLDEGDIIMDGGNSYFQDTIQRVADLRLKNIHFIGMGISGGEEGARNGPSLMPGGSKQAYEIAEPMLQTIAATTPGGEPCCRWIGENGAGHFVKMVHNGIEYADMQIIAETCHILQNVMGFDADEISATFRKWNDGKLNSYLTGITADIFATKDEDGKPLIEVILDAAKQKGTGRWTVISALEMGVPIPVISESVFSRSFSGLKQLRFELSENYKKPGVPSHITPADLEEALYASRIMAHAEGFFLIQNSSEVFGWSINPLDVASVWQAGCIIQSSLLKEIVKVYKETPQPGHLLLSPLVSNFLDISQESWRKVVNTAVVNGIPVPATSAALAEFDMLRTERLPTNIIQAQRDYFGAHTYERTDSPRGTYFHTDWKNRND